MPCYTVLKCSQASLEACDGALSRISIKKKITPRLHEGCAIGHNAFVRHLDPRLSVEFQARLHEVQAPMMPEAITPRVVAVCDAVNRSGVSSSTHRSLKCSATAKSLGVTKLELSGTGEKKTMFPHAEECSKMCPKTGLDGQLEAWVAMLCTRRRVRKRHVPRQSRDMADPNRSSCSDGWAARAAGKRTRPTR